MVKATLADRDLCVEILCGSFENNQSVNFIVKQDDDKIKRIKALMEYSFNMCLEFGVILLSDDHKACALYLYPHLKKTTFYALWLDVKLIFTAIGISRICKAINREGQIKNVQPKQPMAYLWFIGVDPHFQYSGLGSTLLQETIELADIKHLPVYLETSTLKNLPWYESFGFSIYHQLDLGYTLYFLKRKSDKD
ncbi:GNAT family N-acetyltransferase [Mucilaginibacter polytrichastri]|uniref:N-acetyltransferase domain-containing protein n=1 Tax=Mucilaginibacter polytrichastri TaxID=1302689 RepID=A0A1Q6A401_9SPHI|nr:GNAT family N-acetyltransferase [Mucilaginibacter polytrichastri]OKS88735.1 hypothetical protein RG47T_4213 [Mucilaginibacter polytrichastri]SFT05017.1 Acetyltransferase (GNAT) family protein [Mucilaginibacter polytrichastri]